MAMLSIMGLYNYDPDIFQGFRVPGRADITTQADTVPDPFVPDRQIALDYILTSCAELSLVYTKPDFVKFMIRSWTERRFPVWKAMYNTMLYKYNPIWNKDGTIEETRDLTEEDDEATTGSATSGKTTIDDEDTTGHVESSGSTDADIRGNVTAYDTDDYSPNEQQTQDIGTTSEADHSGTRDLTRTESGTATSTGSRDRDRTEKENTIRREYGNIGVTMTQQMIRAERDVAMFSLYELIKEDFKSEFCVMVY